MDIGSQGVRRRKAHEMRPVAMVDGYLFRSRAGQLSPGPCVVLLRCRKAVVPVCLSRVVIRGIGSSHPIR